MGRLDLRVLGPVEATVDGRLLELGPPRQRALLALLVVRANQVVSTDRLVEELWGDSPPVSAGNALQVYVSNLRRVLEPGRVKGEPGRVVVTRAPGYTLELPRGGSDLDRFESSVAAARRAASGGRADLASVALDEALALWRGQALADVADEPFAVVAGARLEEARLAAVEDWADAHLALGHHAALVAELDALTRSNPLRERLWGQLMLGLYRSGRQADALRAYQRLRSMLGEELGLEPGPSLRHLETAVLGQAPELDWVPPRDGPADIVSRSSPVDATAGTLLSAARGGGDAVESRAVITVVVANLVGSTVLGERLEPEESELVAEGAIARMLGPVAALGGSVSSVAGEGIVALFGAPAVHEDDAERAVRAALRIVDEVSAYGVEVGQAWGVEPLSVRVGVHTGAVVFGPGGGGEAAAGTVWGDTLNNAVSLEAAARPGTVLVGESTRRLAQPLCAWGEKRLCALDGEAQPAETIAAWEADSLNSGPGKVRGIEGVDVDIVGRAQELARGYEAVDAVVAGRGGILLIGGEAGVGKTRLLAELRRRFRTVAPGGAGAAWLEGRCVSYGESLHYWPLRELLREWVGASPNQPELRARITLRRKTRALFGDAAPGLLPALGVVLGLPLERDAADRVATLRPESVQQSVFDALWALLARLAEAGPVVVAIDDLHWADNESSHLLERLVPLSEQAAVLFVLVGRPDRAHPSWRLRELTLRELAHRSHDITLGALTRGADAELLAALVGPATLPDELASRVLAAAEGNPFYVEELVRSLIGAGALVLDSGAWRFDHDVNIEIPETVEKVLLSRIDQMPPGARSVLRAASVLGRQFRADLLDAVVGDEGAAVEAMAQLHRADLLEQARRWPRPEHRFKHVLIQEAAYRTLTPQRRRELHGRAAHALETRFPDRTAESYGLLARHLTEAGEPGRALAYRLLAASEARRVYAVDVAMAHYAAGLELAAALPAATARAAIDELHLGRGQVWALSGDPTRARPEFETAVAGARAAGNRKMQGQALGNLGLLLVEHGERRQGRRCFADALVIAEALADRSGQVTLLNRLAVDLANDLEFVHAMEHTEAALALANETGEELVAATALDGRKLIAAYLGDFAVLNATVATLADILRRHNDLWTLSFTLAESAVEAAAKGRWVDAVGLIEEALAIKRRIADRKGQPLLLAMLAWVHRSRGAYQDALDTCHDALAMAVDVDHPWWMAWAGNNLGATLLELRCPEQATEPLALAYAAAERVGLRSQLLRSCAHLGWASWLVGDISRAEALLGRADELLASIRAPEHKAWLFGADAYHAVARLHLARGKPTRALEVLTPLVAAAEAAGWGEALAVGLVLVARGQCAVGSPRRAEAALTRALAVAHAHTLPAPALEAHTALAQISRAQDHERAVDSHVTDALEIITRIADAIRTPGSSERFVAMATSDLRARPSP